jgi:hypothetical protein
MPGPVPKKDAERRRRNKSSEKDGSLSHIPAEVVNLDVTIAGEVEIPEMDEHWHDIAKLIWESQTKSGQALWMEPSDWATLYMTCESISRDMKPQVISVNEETGEPVFAVVPLKGANLNAYMKVFASLLMTEGDRRRLRIELERQRRIDAAAEGDGKVVDIVAKRQELFG